MFRGGEFVTLCLTDRSARTGELIGAVADPVFIEYPAKRAESIGGDEIGTRGEVGVKNVAHYFGTGDVEEFVAPLQPFPRALRNFIGTFLKLCPHCAVDDEGAMGDGFKEGVLERHNRGLFV